MKCKLINYFIGTYMMENQYLDFKFVLKTNI